MAILLCFFFLENWACAKKLSNILFNGESLSKEDIFI